MKNQKGFSSTIIIVGTLVLIGVILIGWSIVKNNSNKKSADTSNTSQSSSSDSSSSSASSTNAALTIDKSKLPTSWSVVTNDPNFILISNSASRCFAQAISSDDIKGPNAPTVDHNKQTIDAIQAKGNTVDTSDAIVSITTASGRRQLRAQQLTITGTDVLYQKFAYISTGKNYTTVSLSCPAEQDLPTADTALLAIKFNKQ